jgi:hypothetical protein
MSGGWATPGQEPPHQAPASLPPALPVVGQYPPAPRNPSRRVRGAVIFIALVVVVVAAGVAAIVISSESDDDGGGDGRAVAPVGPGGTVPTPVEFVDPDGRFSLSMPDSWVGMSTRGDVRGLGAATFPDDGERAAQLEQMLSAVPRQIVFVGIDPDTLGTPFVTNTNVVAVPTTSFSDSLDDLEEAAPAEVERTAGASQVGEPTRVALPAGEAVRIEYEAAPLGFVQYYVLEGDTLWTLTMNTDDLDAHDRVFNAIAGTFALGEG